MSVNGDVKTLCRKKSLVKPFCYENSRLQYYQSKVSKPSELGRETEIKNDSSGDKLNTNIFENNSTISDIDDDDEYIDFYLIDYISDSPEAVSAEPLEDHETDSAYSSLEDDGNMPNFDILNDHGRGLLGGKQSEEHNFPYVNNTEFLTLEQLHSYLKPGRPVEQNNGKQPIYSVKSSTVTYSDSTECTESTSSQNGYNYIARKLKLPSDNVDDVVNDLEELTEADVESVIPIEFSSNGHVKGNEVSKSVDLHHAVPIPATSEEFEDEGIALDLDNFESNIGKAYEESRRSDSLRPLIKEELKCVIQCRRLKDGKPELFLEPERPKVYKLTEAEIKKKHDRLEQNRKSAWKSRQRSRFSEEQLIKYVEMAEDARITLVKEKKRLRHLKNGVLNRLKQHLDNCMKTQLAASHKRIIELTKV